jgi:hypothetical protein
MYFSIRIAPPFRIVLFAVPGIVATTAQEGTNFAPHQPSFSLAYK